MKKIISLLSLLAGFILPVILMIKFHSSTGSETLIIAFFSVLAGWICNVVWASTTALEIFDGDQSNTRKIALKFGWICPSIFVLATFLVQLMFR